MAAKRTATKRSATPKAIAPVKRPALGIQPTRPVPPIGGFPGISTPGFLRGMARQGGLLKGDIKPRPKVALRKIAPPRGARGGAIARGAPPSGALAAGGGGRGGLASGRGGLSGRGR